MPVGAAPLTSAGFKTRLDELEGCNLDKSYSWWAVWFLSLSSSNFSHQQGVVFTSMERWSMQVGLSSCVKPSKAQQLDPRLHADLDAAWHTLS